ncbi:MULTISPECIES: YdcF family protein [unclassified Massilia]|uniref:YdcF family protein n=1 Tax=unclassified Massilia TaxID=2609279 RepID=UPI00178046D8|nr:MULTISPECIES: YdcF family protein [unclassified Massilia]MBD8532968.1 YdcF family protein [Massilia sp. CFBP 13647]MBD8676378.1 YdcF family protein [Massilia sp. CFBP 13721]
MTAADLLAISRYVMPALPLHPAKLGFLFGTRHGVDEFCRETYGLWQRGMFERLLISGGATAGQSRPEAEVIAERLVDMGMPASILILESQATNTGENVILGRRMVAQHMNLGSIDSVLAIGKVCAMRRYLMTLARYWPEVSVAACAINYFGQPAERWHEHAEFRARVLNEFHKIPLYLQQDFLRELDGHGPYPLIAAAP